MLENYRLQRAKKQIADPLLNPATAQKGKFLFVAATVLAMAVVAYLICFVGRAPVIPNMAVSKSAQVHIVSTIDFSYKSDILTQQRRDLNAERIPLRYKINEHSLKNATELKNKLLAFFNSNQAGYEESVKSGKTAAFLDEIAATLRKSTLFEIPPADIELIYSETSEKSREELFGRAIFYVRNILSDGVYQDDDKVFADANQWLNPSSNVNVETAKHAASVSTAARELHARLKNVETQQKLSSALYRIFRQCITPNIEFDAEKTKQLRDAARAEVQPVSVRIREGETLADSESLNAPLTKEKLRAYKAEILKRGEGDINNIPLYINFLVCLLLTTMGALFIIISKTQRNKKPRTVCIFCTLLVLNLLAERFVIGATNTENWSDNFTALQIITFATPLFLGPIIQVLLFGAYLGFIMSIMVSALAALMMSESVPFFVLSLTASLVAIYLCAGATNRYRVILSGLVYGLFVAAVAAVMGICMGFPLLFVGEQALATVVGGLLTSLIALALLPMIEAVFKCNSNISLLDYTDLNNKKANLLKTLQIVAPGTYHHSVMVSYIAEAAAQAVKVNSMVCRVGALYHDIGKLSKPEFFSENQGGQNPHDEQNPSMSALIIKNHVTDGIAKAEVEKMPRQIIDAISQHHGTSIISYFFNKAKKIAGCNNINREELDRILREEGIEESTYRHEGEKPQTVENAIIMIADSCEAASRSMKKVTKHGIDSLVEAIVNGKMTDGQFDECPITVKQISVIKKTVALTMLNMLHSRVDYKQQ